MKIHPEMQEIVQQEMEKGLKRGLSPEQVLQVVRLRMFEENKAIHGSRLYLRGDVEMKRIGPCECGGFIYCSCSKEKHVTLRNDPIKTGSALRYSDMINAVWGTL